jgi:DNA-binding CsgD family transcriptional regulator
LLEEALRSAGGDVALAAQLEAALALVYGARFDAAGATEHVDRAIELAERAGDSAVQAEALSLRTLVRLVFGSGADEPSLQRALALEDPEREVTFLTSPSLNAAQFYEFTGAFDRAQEILAGVRQRVVARGEENALAFVLVHTAVVAVAAGDLEVAEREATEALRIASLTHQELFTAFALGIRARARAVSGDLDGARKDATESLAMSERIGWSPGTQESRWPLAIAALSQDDAAAAATLLDAVAATIEQTGVYEWPAAMSIPDAIEAFVATGEVERAARLTGALSAWGEAHDRPWALALSGRCRALLAATMGDLDAAVGHAERALAEHERLPMPFELARTVLLLGQLQRRRGERRAARESLERAVALFEGINARLWAEKAGADLRRIGVRRAPEDLTENEDMVARLAADGLTNREIAERMFISRRTVEANLARAYRKLGIHSRAELGATMARREQSSA